MEDYDGHPTGQNAEYELEYQLNIMRKRELKIYMDNQQVTLEEALSRCVQERTVYMPDYVLDENGILEQVRFDRIDL